MKSLDAFEARTEARTESRLYANLAVSLIQDGLYALDRIAELCHMSLQQVQDIAATIQR